MRFRASELIFLLRFLVADLVTVADAGLVVDPSVLSGRRACCSRLIS